MMQARERQRQKEGRKFKASQVRVGCCRTHYHRRRGRSKASSIVIDGVSHKLGKRGRKNRVEDERGGQDEGIRLVIQI